MPGHIDNKAIYHKRVLIPFWILQLTGVCVLLVFAVLNVVNLLSYLYGYYSSRTASPLALFTAASTVAVALAVAFLVLHIVQITQFGRRKLTPKVNFHFELWRCILLLPCIILQGAAAGLRFYSRRMLLISCILWALYLGSLIYASVLFHRFRRGRYNLEGASWGQHPSGYTQPPYQQGPYYQGHFQQPQFPPGPYQQGPQPPPESYQPLTLSDYSQPTQTMQQNFSQQSDITSRQTRTPTQANATPLTAYSQSVVHGSDITNHSTSPAPQQTGGSDTMAPQELRTGALSPEPQELHPESLYPRQQELRR